MPDKTRITPEEIAHLQPLANELNTLYRNTNVELPGYMAVILQHLQILACAEGYESLAGYILLLDSIKGTTQKLIPH